MCSVQFIRKCSVSANLTLTDVTFTSLMTNWYIPDDTVRLSTANGPAAS